MTLTRQRLSGLVLAASIAAAAAPSAWARPIDQFPPAPARGGGEAPPPVRVVHVSSDSGFDWGDAEIGAGAVVAAGLVGLGSLIAVRRRRTRPATTI
jgi:hypothetical protein